MSTFTVPVVQLGKIGKHPNADSLSITQVEAEDKLKFVTGTNERDPGFMPVYDVEHYRKNRHVLEPGEEVVVTEKIHGCNGRWGFGRARGEEEYRLWVGSHNCIKRLDPENPCLWWQIALEYDLEEKLRHYPGMVVYGEVYGQVQDLKYGTKPGEYRLAVFDVYCASTGTFLGWSDLVAFCRELGLPMVPTLYVGPWAPEKVEPLAAGDSTLAANIREGIVIKPTEDRWDRRCGRVILKLISEAYLLRKGGTEAQ